MDYRESCCGIWWFLRYPGFSKAYVGDDPEYGAYRDFDEAAGQVPCRLAILCTARFFGIVPDLTCSGVIGGGLPVEHSDAREFMEQIAPSGTIYQA